MAGLEIKGSVRTLSPVLFYQTNTRYLIMCNNQLKNLPAGKNIDQRSKRISIHSFRNWSPDQSCLSRPVTQSTENFTISNWFVVCFIQIDSHREHLFCLGDLVQLKRLYLESNCLKNLPYELGKLNLEDLGRTNLRISEE